jgi:hypothetical protein
MLYFDWPHTFDNVIEWHIGDPIPDAIRRSKSVSLQADGHELAAILDALTTNTKKESTHED